MSGQLVLDFGRAAPPDDDRHPNLERLRSIGLGTAAFYWCGRELAAGRACPMKLTAEQRAYVDRWLP